MTGYLEGRTVIVTGAGRGLGRAAAEACAGAGANVVVADNGVTVRGESPEAAVAQEVADGIAARGGSATAMSTSVTTLTGAEQIVSAAVDTYGQLDAVICAAGILRPNPLHEMTEEEWTGVLAVHLTGTFTMFRAALPAMRARQTGSLLAYTSASYVGTVAQPNYSSAKGGIVSLVRSAALTYRDEGITANAIAPAAFTRMMDEAQSWTGPMSLTVKAASNIGQSEDVAPLAVYLVSDRARHVTGQVYTANGNKIAVWNQPREVRSMFASDRWTPEEIERRLDTEISQERMALMDKGKE